MNELILHIISCCFREILYSHAAMAFGWYLVYRACGLHQLKLGPFVAVVELRMLIDLLVLEVLPAFWGQEGWCQFLRELLCLFHPLAAIYLASYFCGHLGKTILAVIWTEPFAVGCLLGAYTLAYRDTGAVYTMVGQPFSLRDGLVLLFYLTLCVICALALSSVLRFYRNYPFKHPRLLLCLALMGMFEQVYINMFAALPRSTYHLSAELLLGSLAVLLLAGLWRKRARLQRQLYAQQMRWAESHLALLRERAAWAMDSRALLEQQISLAESLPQKEQTALMRSYLDDLKAQYTKFLKKMRCKDPLVDALLCHQEIACRKEGISMEFSLQRYGRGSLKEQEIVTLLLPLFDGAVQSCKKNGMAGHIALSMALLKGQFLLEIRYSGREKLTKDGIRPILNRHNGMFFQERIEEGWRAEILLDANSDPGGIARNGKLPGKPLFTAETFGAIRVCLNNQAPYIRS